MSNNQFNRQAPRQIVVDLGVDNVGADNKITAKLPMGAFLQSVQVLGVEAFNTGTTGTATASVGDGTTVFANGVDVKTVGNKTVANAPKFYPQGGTLEFSLAETVVDTAATAGRVLAVASYVVVGAGDSVHG